MWTEGRVSWLRTYWAEGFSGAEIARLLGGVSRSAVIGKIHRLGLAGRSNPGSDARKEGRCDGPKRIRQPTRAYRRPKLKKQPPQAPETVQPLQIPLIDLRANQCRAVTDTTPWEQRFCGHPVAFGSPYCASHYVRFHCVAASKTEALAA